MGIVKAVVQNTKRGDPDQSLCVSMPVSVQTSVNMWDSTNDIQFWGFLQVNVGIIAACAPSLKPIVGGILHLPSTQQSKSRSNFASGSNGQTNKTKIQSRIRVSDRGQSKGWIRTGSDIELDRGESFEFSSQTHITCNQDERTVSH
jgi:hypothetical protein